MVKDLLIRQILTKEKASDIPMAPAADLSVGWLLSEAFMLPSEALETLSGCVWLGAKSSCSSGMLAPGQRDTHSFHGQVALLETGSQPHKPQEV